jgi:uncharacterized LabA/DUF88 family protein
MNPRSPRHTPSRAGAAVHRPAPAPTPIAVAAPLTYAPNAALLIDFDNVTLGIRSDLQTELKTLLASDIIKGKVQLRRAYADWRRYPQYVAPLAESSIDMIMAPAYGSSKKNATDIRLAIDALELVFTRPEIGTYILLSGDSDFSTLVIKLKEYGKYVIGVGIRESSSDLLVMNCDEYYSYNALAGLVRTAAEEEADAGPRRDPWELVTESLARMIRNGDVMRADRLKQVMQDIDSTFDEKNLGMSKFSRFVQEAAHRGLISLSKMDNGQLEVGLPKPGEGAADIAAAHIPAPARPPAAVDERPEGAGERLPTDRDGKAHAEREERGRRRRGGRGRGRDREAQAARGSSAIAEAVGTAPSEVSQDTRSEEPKTAAEPVAEHAAPKVGDTGERLTRDEAFDLVRRAVSATTSGGDVARASDVRAKAFELLGRDSESLSERNFSRILRDAHDADLIDLRRRGDDYEVAPAVSAAPVAQQLNAAAAAHTPAASQIGGGVTPAGPAMKRGLGVRGARRGGLGGRAGSPPADLLSIGIVDVAPASSPVARESGIEAEHPLARVVEEAPQAVAGHAAGLAPHGIEVPVTPAHTPRSSPRTATAKRGTPRARAKRAAPAASGDAAPKAKRARPRAAAKSTDA